MHSKISYPTIAFLVSAILVGCTKDDDTQAHVDGSRYHLAEEPPGAIQVLALAATAAHNESVTVVGRIGGPQPWVEGLSAFNLVDSSLPSCDEIPGDDCKTPWDYCCETDLVSKQTLIKIVDPAGSPLDVGAKDLLKIKELQTVVVQGKLQRDAVGNMSILASGIYVRP